MAGFCEAAKLRNFKAGRIPETGLFCVLMARYSANLRQKNQVLVRFCEREPSLFGFLFWLLVTFSMVLRQHWKMMDR